MKPEDVEPDIPVNRKILRTLLIKSFSHEELKDLCFDHYPAIYDSLGNDFGKNVTARLLLDYCQRQGLINQLLGLIKEHNPYQYARYAEELSKPAPPPSSSAGQPKTTLKITLPSIEIENFTPDKQAALVHLIAEELNIPEEEITIHDIRRGSTIIELSLPAPAARQLIALYYARTPLIEDLRIGRIERITPRSTLRERITKFLSKLSRSFKVFITLTISLLFLATLATGPLTTIIGQDSIASPVAGTVFVTPAPTVIVASAPVDLITLSPTRTDLLTPTKVTLTTTSTTGTPASTPVVLPTPMPAASLTPTSTPVEEIATTAPTQTPTRTPPGSTPPPTIPTKAVVAIEGLPQIEAGQVFTVTVNIKDIQPPGVFGAQFDLIYDPTILEAIRIMPNPELLVVMASFDNERGQANFAASRHQDVSNFIDDVTFATITLQAKAGIAATTTNLDIENVKLGAKGGLPVSVVTQALALEIK